MRPSVRVLLFTTLCEVAALAPAAAPTQDGDARRYIEHKTPPGSPAAPFSRSPAGGHT
jgi:hypothetical protein